MEQMSDEEKLDLRELEVSDSLYLFLSNQIKSLKVNFSDDFMLLNLVTRYEKLIIPGIKIGFLRKIFQIIQEESLLATNDSFYSATSQLKQSFFKKLKSILDREKVNLRNSRNWYGFSFEAQALDAGITSGSSNKHSVFINVDNTSVDRADRNFFIENNPFKDKLVILRIHSECFYGDVFEAQICDCGAQLKKVKKLIESVGNGLIIYLRQEGRGLGLERKNQALLKSQKELMSPDEAMVAVCGERDLRSFDFIIPILKRFKVDSAAQILLITDNPEKVGVLTNAGFNVEQLSAAGECLSLKSAIEILEKVIYANYSESMIEKSEALKWIALEVEKTLEGQARSPYFDNFLSKIKFNPPAAWPESVRESLLPIFSL